MVLSVLIRILRCGSVNLIHTPETSRQNRKQRKTDKKDQSCELAAIVDKGAVMVVPARLMIKPSASFVRHAHDMTLCDGGTARRSCRSLDNERSVAACTLERLPRTTRFASHDANLTRIIWTCSTHKSPNDSACPAPSVATTWQPALVFMHAWVDPLSEEAKSRRRTCQFHRQVSSASPDKGAKLPCRSELRAMRTKIPA